VPDLVEYIKTEHTNLDPIEMLQASPGILLGVTQKAAEILKKLEINTVFDLASSRIFINAGMLLEAGNVNAETLSAHLSSARKPSLKYLQPELLALRYSYLSAEIDFIKEDRQQSYEISGGREDRASIAARAQIEIVPDAARRDLRRDDRGGRCRSDRRLLPLC
jgi:hypothetical protein